MTQRLATRANTFGEYVVHRRGQLGWTQAELSDRIGIARPIVCDVEKGKRLPELRSAQRWAKALRTTTAFLVYLLLQQQVNEADLYLLVEVTDP